MEPKTKKTVLVVGSLLAIAGIVLYLLHKRKSDAAAAMAGNSTDSSGNTAPIGTKITTQGPVQSTTKPIVKVGTTPPKNVGIPIQTAKAQLVSARDLLAGNPNAANQKAIYAQYDNLVIYNANIQPVRKTKANEFLGVISKTENINGNYWFRFIASGGVVYKMPITGVLVKTN
jgi:hypothetical protein